MSYIEYVKYFHDIGMEEYIVNEEDFPMIIEAMDNLSKSS